MFIVTFNGLFVYLANAYYLERMTNTYRDGRNVEASRNIGGIKVSDLLYRNY